MEQTCRVLFGGKRCSPCFPERERFRSDSTPDKKFSPNPTPMPHTTATPWDITHEHRAVFVRCALALSVAKPYLTITTNFDKKTA